MGQHSAGGAKSYRVAVIAVAVVLAAAVVTALAAAYLSSQASVVVPSATGPRAVSSGSSAPSSSAVSAAVSASVSASVSAPQSTMKARVLRPAPVYTFPIVGCDVTYANAHHDYPAADMFTGRGCEFVAPLSGVVEEIETVDTWDSGTNLGASRGGRSVSIIGDDGVRYYGSHLESVADGIAPGVRVEPGDVLGYVGDSGSAAGTGTHLHFALSWPTPPGYWWVRRGTTPPAVFLDAWRAGEQLSPVEAVEAARRAYGDDSECHVYC